MYAVYKWTAKANKDITSGVFWMLKTPPEIKCKKIIAYNLISYYTVTQPTVHSEIHFV